MPWVPSLSQYHQRQSSPELLLLLHELMAKLQASELDWARGCRVLQVQDAGVVAVVSGCRGPEVLVAAAGADAACGCEQCCVAADVGCDGACCGCEDDDYDCHDGHGDGDGDDDARLVAAVAVPGE